MRHHELVVPVLKAAFINALLVSAFFFTCVAVFPAAAQISLGPYVGAEIGRANTFPGISARFGGEAIQYAPSVEASFKDGFSRWQANADVLYRFNLRESVLTPYLGAGIALRDTPSTNAGLGANAIAGVSLNAGPLVPFIQSRITVASSTALTMMGGLLITPPYRRD